MFSFRFAAFLLIFHHIDRGKVDADVRTSSELDCDFSGSFCGWRNLSNRREDELDWEAGNRVVSDFFHSVPRGAEGLDDRFAYVRGPNNGQANRAMLISDIISCQSNTGLLRFLIWKTAVPPTLAVCVRSLDDLDLRCGAPFTGYLGPSWVTASVEIPAESKPFQVIFLAVVSQVTDILAIDKIVYDAQICDISPFPRGRIPPSRLSLRTESPPEIETTTIPPTTTTTRSIRQRPQLEDCHIAECSFYKNFCDYHSAETGTGRWRVECSAVRTRDDQLLTAAEGACFALATSVRGESSHLLVSRSFFTLQESVLQFYYYIPVYGDRNNSRLSVCINSFDECIWQVNSPPRLLERWWKTSIPLPPGRLQLYFVVDQSQRLDFVALDEIRLSQSQNGAIAQCQVYDDDVTTV